MAIKKEIAEQLKQQIESNDKKFDQSRLSELIDSCSECKLSKLDSNKIRLKPWGYVNSIFMLVGQNPSSAKDENSSGFFWWPKSSNGTFATNYSLLKEMFESVGIDFWTMWKTNAQKCKYASNNDFDANCLVTCEKNVLQKEIELVDPQVVFLLGTEVAKSFGIVEKHKLIEKDGRKYCWIYHPSYHTRGGISKDDYVSQLSSIKDELKKIRNTTFINYHQHNQFSLRDGLGDEKSIADRLGELRYPGMSLTNHGNVNVHYRQYLACRERGLKPIFGTEIYYNPHRKDIMASLNSDVKEDVEKRKEFGQHTYHLTVVAKNEKGYYNLISMNNEALMTSFYKFPLIDDELLEKYKEGLVVFSGCPGGFIPVHVFSDIEEAKSKARTFQKIFGKDFYIELMSTKYDYQKLLNDKLIVLADELKLPIIITNDSHYIKKEHSKVHDILLLGGSEITLEDAQDPSKKVWQFTVRDLHIKSTNEIREDHKTFLKTELFTEKRLNDCFDSVHNLFCHIEAFEIDSSIRYPKIDENSDSEQMFRNLIVEGIKRKKKYIEINDEFKKRLNFEMDNIIQLGFVDYLIVLQDILNWAKKKFGPYSIGPGRGSSAASLVCYLLGITDVNPLKYDLMLFERFMSPGRKDPLDIDSDLGPSVRKEIIDYAVQKFGRNQVFPVGTQGTMKLKMTIHDVFKALGIEFQEIVKYTKLIGADKDLDEAPIEEVIKQIPTLKHLFQQKPEALEYVEALRGRIRSFGQHAAGIVISGVDITKTLPLARTSADVYVTSNTEGGDNREITQLGFIKYDLLSLTTVDLINETSALIKERHGVDVVWDDIHAQDDKLTEMYEILAVGDCYGIFQFGSKLAIDYLKQMIPTTINDLCAASALLRPGPLDERAHLTYARRKNGEENFEIHPALKPFLGETYGVLIYQEQVLRITQELCKFDKIEANKFRKDLVKYEKALEYERARLARVKSKGDKIVEAFIASGMTAEAADKWWNYIEAFSRYAFNFAHSMSYAYHSFRQLWQKYYYTIEFYTAAFNSEGPDSFGRIVTNIRRFPARKIVNGKLQKYKIQILPPDLRKKNAKFVIEDDGIRHGLTFIKYISPESVSVFQTLTDEELSSADKLFVARREKDGKQKFVIDKKLVTALIYSGSLDYLGDRSDLAKKYSDLRKSQVDIFTGKEDLVSQEDYYVGYSLIKREHFLQVREKLESKNLKTISDLQNSMENAIEYVTVKSITEKKTKNGKPYRMISIETLDEFYPQIFVWSDIKLNVGRDYLCKFSKDESFIKLLEALVV